MIIETPFQVQDGSGNTTTITPADLVSAVRNAARPQGSALNGSPSYPSVLRENMSRAEIGNYDVVPGATQKMTLVAVPLQAGDVISSVSFLTGSTAANTPTNHQAALYSLAAGTFTTRALSNDNLSTAWAGNTPKTFTFSTAYTVPTSGVYYAAISIKATTVPSFAGCIKIGTAANGPIVTGQAFLAQTSDAPGGTCPPTATATTAVVGVPYVVASS